MKSQIYTLELDNTLNQSQSVFFLYDASSTAVAAIGVPGGVVSVLPMPVGWSFASKIDITCASDYTGTTAALYNCGATAWGK